MFTDDAGTSVSLPVGPNGVTTLTFADGSFDAGYSDGDVFIGDQIVTDVPDTIGSDGDGGGDGEIFNYIGHGGDGDVEDLGGGEGEIFNSNVTPVAAAVAGAGDLVFKIERAAGEGSDAEPLNGGPTARKSVE